jgi:hypothetical protein
MLKLVSLKLRKYLKRTLVTLLWVKEYQQTVCQTGAYLLLIRQGRKKMDEEQDWIHNIVPHSQIESMMVNAKKIEKGMDDGVSIVMSTDNLSAVELCQCWQLALYGDKKAWLKMSSFLANIVATIEEHLAEEGINPYEE